MLSESCAHTHQSLRVSSWPGLPPISVWKPEIAVPQRKPGGKAARAEQASVATSARRRTNLRMGFPLTHCTSRAHRKNAEFRGPTGGSTCPSVEHPQEHHNQDDASSPSCAQVEAPCPAVG